MTNFKLTHYPSHRTVLRMAGHGTAVEARRHCLAWAMTQSDEWLKLNTTTPVEEIMVRNDVTDVVFVIHGIRDVGYWTQKIARRTIIRGMAQGRRVASETSTYGRFPMLGFIWPRTRSKKVEWLMDEYAEAVARYPNAKFAYMGHSNGTYMLARSLEDYPVVRFTNVVFAGSVVVTDYNRIRDINQGRINRVLNYTASSDWVVAIFPKLFPETTMAAMAAPATMASTRPAHWACVNSDRSVGVTRRLAKNRSGTPSPISSSTAPT